MDLWGGEGAALNRCSARNEKTAGASQVAKQLIYHPMTTHVHITGGNATHDAIVWGPPGEQREERLKANKPVLKVQFPRALRWHRTRAACSLSSFSRCHSLPSLNAELGRTIFLWPPMLTSGPHHLRAREHQSMACDSIAILDGGRTRAPCTGKGPLCSAPGPDV